MLFGGVTGIGQVLEMIPDLILLALALILIPVAFFWLLMALRSAMRVSAESLSSWFRASPLSRRASMAF